MTRSDRRGPGEADDAGGGGGAAKPDRGGQGQLPGRPTARHRHLPQEVPVSARDVVTWRGCVTLWRDVVSFSDLA